MIMYRTIIIIYYYYYYIYNNIIIILYQVLPYSLERQRECVLPSSPPLLRTYDQFCRRTYVRTPICYLCLLPSVFDRWHRYVTLLLVLLESAVRVPTVDIPVIILTPIVSIKKLTVRYTKVLYTVCLCAQHPAVIPCSQNNIWCQMTHSTVRLVTTSSTVLIYRTYVCSVSVFLY